MMDSGHHWYLPAILLVETAVSIAFVRLANIVPWNLPGLIAFYAFISPLVFALAAVFVVQRPRLLFFALVYPTVAFFLFLPVYAVCFNDIGFGLSDVIQYLMAFTVHFLLSGGTALGLVCIKRFARVSRGKLWLSVGGSVMFGAAAMFYWILVRAVAPANNLVLPAMFFLLGILCLFLLWSGTERAKEDADG